MTNITRTVHKYRLGFHSQTTVMAAPGSKPLCVDERDGSIYLWMLTTLGEPTVEYRFLMIGTGFVLPPVGELYEYVGTVHMKSGLVMHVFRAPAAIGQL